VEAVRGKDDDNKTDNGSVKDKTDEAQKTSNKEKVKNKIKKSKETVKILISEKPLSFK